MRNSKQNWRGSLAKLMETVYDHNLTDEIRELLGVRDNR